MKPIQFILDVFLSNYKWYRRWSSGAWYQYDWCLPCFQGTIWDRHTTTAKHVARLIQVERHS